LSSEHTQDRRLGACASGDAISTGLAIGHGVVQHTRDDAEADNEHFDKNDGLESRRCCAMQ
jgi:hypothetical protein